MTASIDQLLDSGMKRTQTEVTFLPDPEPREVIVPIISVDDHLIEPPWTFEGRLPAKLASKAPKIIELEGGAQAWDFDGKQVANVGFNAVAGRPSSEYTKEPTRFDEMRRGAWDIKDRIKDMDINGIYASLNFPSSLVGFGGQKLVHVNDVELGLATLRAWNSWHIEEWAGQPGNRIIGCQIPWLLDPVTGAAEIRKNAELGFKSVTFPESTAKLGLPSVHTGHWDPFFQACEETGTVICLHIGSSSDVVGTSADAPLAVVNALLYVGALIATVDWLYSRVPARFPDLRIVMSEGGIGWVPSLIDRLDHNIKHHAYEDTWKGISETPAEVLRRNFRFATIDDPAGFEQRHRIGVENILVEADYPHADSTWPDTQAVLAEQMDGVPRKEVELMAFRNAVELFRHPMPPGVS